eukprot:36577_1
MNIDDVYGTLYSPGDGTVEPSEFVTTLGGYEANPVFWDEVDEDFAFSLFDLDWDSFGVHLSHGMHRVPIIGETGIKSEVCGPSLLHQIINHCWVQLVITTISPYLLA